MQWTIVGLFLIAGLCLAEIEVRTLPTVDTLDDVDQIKAKCDKKTPGSYDRLKLAINETKTCIEGKIDPHAIEKELEVAKKTGSMDEVFKRYCDKRSEYKNCLMKTVNVSKDCLEESEITALDTAIKVIHEIADFACFNDGDRLAMFVAEGGVDCVKSRSENIKDCINATLKINADPSQGFSVASLPNSLPSLGIDKKKCDDLAKIRQCVVNDLESHCDDTTPANIIDALFKFINKSTCKTLKQKRSVNIWKLKRDMQWQPTNMLNFLSMQDKLTDKCKENGGNIDDFGSSLHTAQLCFGKNRMFVTPKDKYLETLKQCTNNLVSNAEMCLSEESKFFPSLLMEALESLIEFAYDHFNLNTLSPTSEIVHCLQRIKSVGGVKKNFDLCIQSPSPPDYSNFSIPNKREICKQWSTLNDCFNDFVKKTCIRDIAVDRFFTNLTEASQRPCRNALIH